MERSVAIKKLTKLLGNKLAWRVNPKAPKHDEREEARAALTTLIHERKALQEQCDARSDAILAADPEYQRLKAEYRAIREKVDHLSAISHTHKFTAGTITSLGFFHVHAEGDTWEEVIAKVEAKKVAA
jgi:hypothetical protein